MLTTEEEYRVPVCTVLAVSPGTIKEGENNRSKTGHFEPGDLKVSR